MKLINGQKNLSKLSNIGPGLSRLPLSTFRFVYDSFDLLFGSGSRSDVTTEDRSIDVGERELGSRILESRRSVQVSRRGTGLGALDRGWCETWPWRTK